MSGLAGRRVAVVTATPVLAVIRSTASKVAPTTELFPMSKINDAIQHVRDGKARYRVVLKADF
ncbi:hypothetical protein AB2M50_004272 [Escherichia coli]|nr:hypothetical protein [Escherichia coli]EKK4374445.1 hypothetical protein [Escherichia coli]